MYYKIKTVYPKKKKKKRDQGAQCLSQTITRLRTEIATGFLKSTNGLNKEQVPTVKNMAEKVHKSNKQRVVSIPVL